MSCLRGAATDERLRTRQRRSSVTPANVQRHFSALFSPRSDMVAKNDTGGTMHSCEQLHVREVELLVELIGEVHIGAVLAEVVDRVVVERRLQSFVPRLREEINITRVAYRRGGVPAALHTALARAEALARRVEVVGAAPRVLARHALGAGFLPFVCGLADAHGWVVGPPRGRRGVLHDEVVVRAVHAVDRAGVVHLVREGSVGVVVDLVVVVTVLPRGPDLVDEGVVAGGEGQPVSESDVA